MNISYSQCPLCKSDKIAYALSASDYTVSYKPFEIWECNSCTLRFTQSVPHIDDIGAYYQSEDYISHTDTSKGLINSLYHKVRKRTLAGKRDLVTSFTTGKQGSILDIGAGTGAFLNTMLLANWQVAGIEPDAKAREKAMELYNLGLKPSEELFGLPVQSFDIITMWHVLEHVHDLHGYINKLMELLRPQGKLVIAVPNYTSYDEKVYKEYWAAYDVPRHLYHFSPQSVRELLSIHELKLHSVKPMWFDSFYVSILSEKNMTGSNNYLKAFITGLTSNLKALSNKEKCSSLIYIIQK